MKMFVAITLLIYLLLISFRDISIGTDTENYLRNYEDLVSCGCITDTFEYGFQSMVFLISMVHAPQEVYLFVIALTSLLLLLWFTKDMFSGRWFYVALSLMLLNPFFVSVMINGVRQGLAAMVVFCSFSQWTRNKSISIFLALLSFYIHKSTILIFPFLVLMFLSVKKLYLVFIVLAGFYALGWTEYIVAELSEITDSNLYYLVSSYNEHAEYKRGVRLDFLMYFLAASFIGVIARSFKGGEVFNICPNYDRILKYYIVLVMPFLWFGWATYSNRYAFYAFLLTPILYLPILMYLGVANNRTFLIGLYLLSLFSLSFMSMMGMAF